MKKSNTTTFLFLCLNVFILLLYYFNADDGEYAFFVNAQKYYSVTIVAGTYNNAGQTDNVPAITGKLNTPTGVGYSNRTGNLYIADSNNYVIREVSLSQGNITTYAGIMSSTATFVYPTSITFSKTGDAYVCDFNDHKLRKIGIDGTVTILAGQSSYGSTGDGGLASDAKLRSPYGTALDPDGNIYIVDKGNHKIRMINITTNIITTIVGSGSATFSGDGGPASKATLNAPKGIFITDSYEIYIADTGSQRIRKISKEGIISTIAGKGTFSNPYTLAGNEGPATGAQLKNPIDIVVLKNGEIFITEDSYIRKIRLDGTITKVAGGGSLTSGKFVGTKLAGSIFEHFALNPITNELYFTSAAKHVVYKMEQAIGCYDVLATDATVCSGHGTCIADDVCQCNSGYVGDKCSVPVCFGNMANETGIVCSGHGTCTANDMCTCSIGWSFYNCSVPLCYNVPANDPTNVCSGNGECIDYNVCSCRANWFGQNCETTMCYDIFSNSSSVCSSHGNCSDTDTCECGDGWVGLNCDEMACYSIMARNSSVCSGRGQCIAPNTCQCNSADYIGSNCEITFCSNISSLNSSVCSGNGACTSLDTCECNSGWNGTNCEFTNCYGILSTDSSVCSGKGVCFSENNCSCYEGYSDINCSTASCFNISSSDSSVCSGNGKCSSKDTCDCFSGWNGLSCELTLCSNISNSDPLVCSSHGKCLSPESCLCYSPYYGNDCELFNCHRVEHLNSTTCSGNGECSSPDNCTCYEGYYGENCELFECFGILFNHSDIVCSGHGQCLSPNQCSCYKGWFSSNCELTSCFGLLSNSSIVCSGNGKCLDENTCSCDENYLGDYCNITSCNGVPSNDPMVCSGNGYCNYNSSCICNTNWLGNNCSIPSCFDIPASNSSLVCSGHGTCSLPNTCSCSNGWIGDDCSITSCFEELSNSSNVCSGNGECLSQNRCLCHNGWIGDNCSIAMCFDINGNDTSVCSGNGKCISPNQCSCSLEWFGETCSITSCFDILSNSSNVCSGHGSCKSPNTCTCNTGWYGNTCANSISTENSSLTSCFGYLSNDTNNACSGNGICVSNNSCSCNNGYTGRNCSIPICFGVSSENNTQVVCSGNGLCNSPNTCICYNGWFSEDCSIPSCFSLLSNNSNVCSGNGICNSTDLCICKKDWIGENCSIPISNSSNNGNDSGNSSGNNCSITQCYGINGNESSVCSNHGICKETDICLCNSGWLGDNCSIPSCFGVLSNYSNVCYGHGKCESPQHCVCNPGWLGENCSLTLCFDILSNDSNICSGHGRCESPNTCTCNTGWYGETCVNSTTQIEKPIESNTSCNGISYNSSIVCNGRGKCLQMNNCTCNLPYYGFDCEFKSITCFGISKNDNNVCSGRGSCLSQDECKCHNSTTSNVSGNNCQNVQCTENYFGNSCSNYCNPIVNCSNHGNCSNTGSSSCICHSDSKNGYWTLDNCSQCKSNYYDESCLTFISPSGKFSNDGKYIQLTLFSSTFSENINCSKLLSNNDYIIMQPIVCKWNKNGELLIQLGYSNTFKPGSNIKVNSNIFNKVLTESVALIDINISPADNPIKPVASISTSTSTYSACDEISIDGSSSYDSYYTNINYQWRMINYHPISSGSASLTAESLQKSILLLDSSIPAGNYSFELIVSNKFNIQSEPSYYSFTKEKITVPQIKIVELEDLNIRIDRVPVYVKQYITFQQCNANDTLSMSAISINWKQIEGPLSDFVILPNNDMVINSFSKSSSLFVYQVSLTFMNLTTTNSRISIRTLDPDFSITLYSSNLNSTQVTINVETDPEEMINSNLLSSSIWKWDCLNSDSITNCDQSIQQSLNQAALIKSSSFILQATETSKTIYLSLLINNKIGYITVTFPKDNSVPLVSLLSVSPSRTVISTSDLLNVRILIEVNGMVDGIDSLIQREWKLNDIPLMDSSPFLLSPKQPSTSNMVIIDASKLQEGTFNTLTCIVTSVKSKLSTIFSYSFEIAVNPKPCYCSVSPSSGYALETLFTFDCPNCLTANSKLKVSFGDTKTSLFIPIFEGASTHFTSELPYTGSTKLPLSFSVIDVRTGAKSEVITTQTILLPKAASIVEIKIKKTSWEKFYKTLANGDPRKVVFDYISSTLNGMTSSLFGKRRELRNINGLCMNGGSFNNITRICDCINGFKKIDCSLSLPEWNEIVNSKSITIQLVLTEFITRNEFEPQSERKLTTQISALYHLYEVYDEISENDFQIGFNFLQKLIQDSKKLPYLSISENLAYAISTTLNTFYKAKLSISSGGGIETNFEQFDTQISESLLDLSVVKLRNQITDSIEFDTMFIKLYYSKWYPSEMSKKYINNQIQFPEKMSTKFQKVLDSRKPIYSKLWLKRYQVNTLDETIENSKEGQLITRVRRGDFSLSLEFVNQILNIEQRDEELISYYFTFEKQINESTSYQSIGNEQQMITHIDSKVVCLSDSVCHVEWLELQGIYACHCSNSSNVVIAERSITNITYQTKLNEPPPGVSSSSLIDTKVIGKLNRFEYLSYLALLSLIVIPLFVLVLILVVVCVVKRRNKAKRNSNAFPKFENVELVTV